MNRTTMMLLLSSALTSTLAAACATTTSSSPREARVTSCDLPALSDPPAEVARGNAAAPPGFSAAVRDPGAEVARGNPPGRSGELGARVVNHADPDVARGNHSPDCTVSLAQARR